MTSLFDFIAALNGRAADGEFYEDLDGWFGFAIHDEAGDDVLTAEFCPWDDASGGPAPPIIKRWRLTEMDA